MPRHKSQDTQHLSPAEEKATKKLGKDTVTEMNAMSEEDLRQVIVQANSSMKEAKDKLDANPEYQQAKADLSLLQSSKKEVDARQKAKIEYALTRLSDSGKGIPSEENQ